MPSPREISAKETVSFMVSEIVKLEAGEDRFVVKLPRPVPSGMVGLAHVEVRISVHEPPQQDR